MSPHCLEALRFTEFHSKMLAKLKAEQDKSNTSVASSGTDNVFRQLMSKIKTLEMNYALIEMYTAQVLTK
jgi:hypothetical protein